MSLLVQVHSEAASVVFGGAVELVPWAPDRGESRLENRCRIAERLSLIMEAVGRGELDDLIILESRVGSRSEQSGVG